MFKLEMEQREQTQTQENQMKFNATAKTNKISGCQSICVVLNSDGNYTGTWASESEDRDFLENCLENDENVIRYSTNE